MSKRIACIIISLILYLQPHAQMNPFRNICLKGNVQGKNSDQLLAYYESYYGKTLLDSFPASKFNKSLLTNAVPGFIYVYGNKEKPSKPLVLFVSDLTDTIEFYSNSGMNYDSILFKNDQVNSLFYEYLRNRNKLSGSQNSPNEKLWNDFEKENSNIIKKLKKKRASAFLAEYITVQHDIQKMWYFQKSDYGQIKKILLKIDKNPALLNTDIPDSLFLRFVSAIYCPENFEKIIEDSFFNLFNGYPFINDVITKFGFLYSSYLFTHAYNTAIQNYYTKFANNPAYYHIANAPKLIKGEKITDIKGVRPGGQLVSIHDFKSTYKVIFIWAPDCSHCLASLPGMNEVYRKFKSERISFVSMSVIKLDSAFGNPFEWKDSYEIQYGWRNEFLVKYAIAYTPVILLIDKKDRVITVETEPSTLSQRLSELPK